ncbi:MAG: tetratricopeptide repeat protein [Akkermansiaceae bacterium]
MIVALLIPTLFLLIFESGLRLFGYGYNSSFTKTVEINGLKEKHPNRYFGHRFFPTEIAREATWFSYPAKKDPGTIRIFVLGGSAAQGDPEPAYGVCRLLGKMLERRFPEVKFEVINAAMTAINSHVVREIADDIVEHDPDLLIVYMGNNEVVGPYGASNPMVPLVDNLAVIRSSIFVKSLRIGQLIESIIQTTTAGPSEPSLWRGMEMFLDNPIRASEPELQTVYGHFQNNLDAILRRAASKNVPVLLSTVAVNLSDCSPFGSSHGKDLTSDELAKWNELYNSGISRRDAEDKKKALMAFSEAAQIDDSHALLHFQIARTELELGQVEQAKQHFGKARNLDTLRFRADTTINRIIRETGKFHSRHVTIVDSEQLLSEVSQSGILGSDFFLEHVHFNFSGNYELAKILLKEVELKLGNRLKNPLSSIPSKRDCKRLLAYSEFDELSILQILLGRLSNPPFTEQFGNSQKLEEIAAKVLRIEKSLLENGFEGDQQLYKEAISIAPEDPWLYYRKGFLSLSGSNNFRQAEKDFQNARLKGLDSAELWLGIGMSRFRQGDLEKAIQSLRKGLAINPRNWRILSQLGFILNLQGEHEEGLRLCRKATEISPDNDGAQTNLGLLLLEGGRSDKALSCFTKAIELGGESGPKLANLGLALMSLGQKAEAAETFKKALAIDPLNFRANRELGDIQMIAGNLSDALKHFGRAYTARPRDLGCANNYAWLLATIPDTSKRNGKKSLDLAITISRNTGNNDPAILDTLAAAYAATGNFEQAVIAANRALSLRPAPALAKQIEERLSLYRKRETFIQY